MSDCAAATARLVENKVVADRCNALIFEPGVAASPGQFVMIWIPGVDEIPMSLSHIGSGRSGITVKIVGDATRALCSLSEGARIRVRGPFGKGFIPRGSSSIIVGGGVGAAPLLPLARLLAARGTDTTLLIGAKRASELLHLDQFSAIVSRSMVATDDGSEGFQGTASELFLSALDETEAESVYCCGPEPMMSSIVRESVRRGLWGQAAIERLVKCGLGICGSCAVNHRLVCRDGPVFEFSELESLREFGSGRRDPAGILRSF